jgi:hypothetical protein
MFITCVTLKVWYALKKLLLIFKIHIFQNLLNPQPEMLVKSELSKGHPSVRPIYFEIILPKKA